MYGLIKSNQVTIGKVEIRETNSKPEGQAGVVFNFSALYLLNAANC